MKTIRDLVISIKEPKNTNIGWLKPTDDANYTLNFFNRGKWTGISISNICKEVTYSQLKNLRDSAKLVPGCYYRITDYQCTTTQSNTKSAGHQFDIIVRADDVNILNEECWAAQHKGDEYFANSNLSAWKIWYCLDNDTSRFAWADKINGKGVIYKMIDEWNNNIPYDFKNIIYQVTPSFLYRQFGGIYILNRDTSIDMNIDSIQYYGYVSMYTPTAWLENKCWIKEELPTINSKLYKSNGSEIQYGGHIERVNLNNYETYTFGKDKDLSRIKNCFNNIILPYSISGKQTLNNNIFGSNCCSNIFGNDCSRNIFGNDCKCNIFKGSCSSIIFGNNCSRNIFGNNCSYIEFALNRLSETKYSYYKNNYFGNDCKYIIFTGKETASSSAQVQNYNFTQGLQGTESLYITIDGVRNRSYETKVSKNSNGELKMYCEADLVQ